ncbi:hypothetical protein KCV00_g284, partial [Aureobasidium melanogenum]
LTLFLSAFCIRLPLVPQNHVCCTQLYDSHQTHLFIVKPPVNQYLINCPAQSSSRRISLFKILFLSHILGTFAGPDHAGIRLIRLLHAGFQVFKNEIQQQEIGAPPGTWQMMCARICMTERCQGGLLIQDEFP